MFVESNKVTEKIVCLLPKKTVIDSFHFVKPQN